MNFYLALACTLLLGFCFLFGLGSYSQRKTIRDLESKLEASKSAHASTGEDLRICNAILNLTLESR